MPLDFRKMYQESGLPCSYREYLEDALREAHLDLDTRAKLIEEQHIEIELLKSQLRTEKAVPKYIDIEAVIEGKGMGND